MNEGFVIRPNNKGRGVYAMRRFRRGQLMMVCPVIVWPRKVAPDDFIHGYLWQWNTNRRDAALPLGIVSMCNHADVPNMSVLRQYRHLRVVCRALRTIQPGEEILVDYGGASDNFKVLP